MRYLDLLNSAISNAQRGMTPEQAANVNDVLAIVDTLFPTISEAVCEAAAADESRRYLVRRQVSITLVAGTATLPSKVLAHYIADAVLIDSTNLNKHYAWRDYPDFVRRGDQRLGVFTMRGEDEFQVIEPNAVFAVPLTASGARVLTVECVIEKPALATDDIDAPPEILNDLDEALTNALRGFTTSKEAGAAV